MLRPLTIPNSSYLSSRKPLALGDDFFANHRGGFSIYNDGGDAKVFVA